MKKSLIITSIFLLTALTVFAQERPRYFDNFDTSKGVYARGSTPTPAAAVNRSPASRKRTATNHILPSPPYGSKYKKFATPGPAPVSETELVRRTALVTTMAKGRYGQEASFIKSEVAGLAMSAGSYLKGHSTGDPMIDAYIIDSSRRYRIDPLLIYSQMNQESSFKLRATSNKGASGLMQLMPATARRLGVTNIYDPKQNIEGGVRYMRMLLDMFSGDVSLALAGYNAGEGAVMKYGYRIPPYNETQDYVRRISARYNAISGAGGTRSVKLIETQAVKSDKTVSAPVSIYDPKPLTIRLEDGRARLVN